jgi:hypothetical protein
VNAIVSSSIGTSTSVMIGAIVGAVLGVCLLIACLVLIVMGMRRHRRRNQTDNNVLDSSSMNVDMNTPYLAMNAPGVGIGTTTGAKPTSGDQYASIQKVHQNLSSPSSAGYQTPSRGE